MFNRANTHPTFYESEMPTNLQLAVFRDKNFATWVKIYFTHF